MLHNIETVFHSIVQYGILLLEGIGVALVLYTAIKSVAGLFRRDPHVPKKLAQGIMLALQFKLGGEVLKTLIVNEWSELALLGAIMLLRAGMMALSHWEISIEELRLTKDKLR
ncbi:MAG: DUF1622 domain-containing protein, partial [Clostridiales bacterium]|nr:DUF1622 domain-containing protein [Clostridiales bacterium]